MIVGTVAYMSPEQATGGQVDARSDIFSFGSLLYEVTTGRRPFQRDSTVATLAAIVNDEPPSAGKIADDVPPAMAAIIERCMRKDPGERFGSAVELKSALTAIRDRPAVVHRAPPNAKRRAQWIGSIAAVLVVGTVVMLFLWWPASPPSAGLLPAVGIRRAADNLSVRRIHPYLLAGRQPGRIRLARTERRQRRYLYEGGRRRGACPLDEGSVSGHCARMVAGRPVDRLSSPSHTGAVAQRIRGE